MKLLEVRRGMIIFITNSVTDQEDLACVYTKRVLQMVEQALKCGERSIKIRQLQRPVRVTEEKTEPPALTGREI